MEVWAEPVWGEKLASDADEDVEDVVDVVTACLRSN